VLAEGKGFGITATCFARSTARVESWLLFYLRMSQMYPFGRPPGDSLWELGLDFRSAQDRLSRASSTTGSGQEASGYSGCSDGQYAADLGDEVTRRPQVGVLTCGIIRP